MIDIHGDPDVGKSTLAYQLAAAFTPWRPRVLIMDLDHDLHSPQAINAGLDPQYTSVSVTYSAMEALSVLQEGVAQYDTVIVDSLASLSTLEEGEALSIHHTDDQYHRLAKVLSLMSRRTLNACRRYNTLVLFTNQVRYQPKDRSDTNAPWVPYVTGGSILSSLVHISIGLWRDSNDLVNWAHRCHKFQACESGTLVYNGSNLLEVMD